MFERFTKEARRTVLGGIEAATELAADQVGPQHLLLSLCADDETTASRLLAGYGVTASSLRAAVTAATRRAGLTEEEIAALRSVGVDADEVFRRIEEAFGPEALAQESPVPARRWRGGLGGPFDRQGKKVLELSLREAIALRDREIGTGHILLALLRAGVPGPLGGELTRCGVTYDDVKRQMLAVRGASAG